MALRPGVPIRLRTRKCPQCRQFSISQRQSQSQHQVGPESPRFIPVPEPPQSTFQYPEYVKGILPVPRDVFGGRTGKEKSSDERIARATPLSSRIRGLPKEGSREEWKQKLSEQRRQNLREGLKALKARKESETQRLSRRALRRQEEREARMHAPEREDERLTAPSHGLDLEKLYAGGIEDPLREMRIADKTQQYQESEMLKRAARMDSLHTLYTRARHFIVTPQQLDSAIETEFGTQAQPVVFYKEADDVREDAQASVWAQGAPERVQDMVNRATSETRNTGFGRDGKYDEVNRKRIRRIGEALTGGRMVVAGEQDGAASQAKRRPNYPEYDF